MAIFSSPIVLVLVGVIGLLIGLLIGFLFVDREPKKAKGQGLPDELTKDGFSEVATLLYSSAKKRVATSLDGGYYREASEMNADQQARMAKVLKVWTDWTGAPIAESATTEGLIPEPAAPAEAEAAQPAPVVEEEPAISEPVQETPEQAKPFPEPFVFDQETEEAVASAEEPLAPETPAVEEAPFISPAEEMAADETPMIESMPVEAKNQSIVEQINQILQGMLEGSAYETRGLNLEDDQQNGVLVYVGGEKYTSIDSVPYEDARELISKAVTEWDQKYEQMQG